MANNGVANLIQIDAGGVLRDAKSFYLSGIQKFAEEMVKEMQTNALVHNYPGPGSPAFREEVKEWIGKKLGDCGAEEISILVGVLEGAAAGGLTGANLVKAMLIEDGSGSRAGGSPIMQGPKGRPVWNDSLTGQAPSNAEETKYLPDGFNHNGNEFFGKTMRDSRSKYLSALDTLNAKLPDRVFYGNTTSTPR